MMRFRSNGKEVSSGLRVLHIDPQGVLRIQTDQKETDPAIWPEVYLSVNRPPVGADQDMTFEVSE